MRRFPSINQFRHCVRRERDVAKFEGREPAKRKYRGTIKLHGTNAGVTMKCSQESMDMVFQSRNRILALGDDNAGFVAHFSEPANEFALQMTMLEIGHNNDIDTYAHDITVFGEWCGQGIQKGVAISELPKMFVIFAAYANGRWLDPSCMAQPKASIYCVNSFPTWEIEIDFARPEIAQNEMVAITEDVERCCPFGKMFGVEGVGEGVVWSPADGDQSSDFWFKVKGEKHSSSKVAKLAAVDVEVVRAKDELVQKLVTESRLEQMLKVHVEENKLTLEMRDIGSFLRSVIGDIAKEETDTIEASGFVVKDLGKPISDIAKRFFIMKGEEELETQS